MAMDTHVQILEEIAADWKDLGRNCTSRLKDYGAEVGFCFEGEGLPIRRLGILGSRRERFAGEFFDLPEAVRTIERLLDMEPPGERVEGKEMPFESLLFHMEHPPEEDPTPPWWKWEFGFRFLWFGEPAVLVSYAEGPGPRFWIARRGKANKEHFSYGVRSFRDFDDLINDISPWEDR